MPVDRPSASGTLVALSAWTRFGLVVPTPLGSSLKGMSSGAAVEAIAALFGALALFWLSTRQFALAARALVWLAGAGLLAWAAIQGSDSARFGLAEALHDAAEHGSNWRDAALVRAFALNVTTIAPFLKQLLDFFLVAAAILGMLSLLAFSRGERMEKMLRPTIIALIGFIAGSAATLGVVAIGFGGYVKPRSYFGDVTPSEVVDGDTFRIGEMSLRLYGADAPEGDQICRGIEPNTCGVTARSFLASQLARAPIQCEQMLTRRSRRPRDSFGRAFVQCWIAPDNGARIDLADIMIRNGYAVQFEGHDYGYADAEREAAETRAGLMSACALRPDRWRNNAQARAAFEGSSPLPAEDAEIVGTCPSAAPTQ